MATPVQRAFLLAQLAVMLVGIGVLASIERLTLESAVVVSFLGLVVITVLTAPAHVLPQWRSRLRWPLLAGGIVFATFVAVRTGAKILAAL